MRQEISIHVFRVALQFFRLTDEALSEAAHIELDKLRQIKGGRERVTADVALRLSKFYGTSAQFWLGLQSDYDLDVAESKIGERLEKEIVPLAA